MFTVFTAVLIAGSAYAQTDGFVSPEDIAGQATVPLTMIPADYPWVAPPDPRHTPPESLKAMIQRALASHGEHLGLEFLPEIRLVDTPEWAAYVNFHHFVPLTAEGAPEGHGYNFNYYEGVEPKSLPVAEVTETGEFVIWRQTLSYYGVPQPYYEGFIADIVSHELRHYRQWQALAVEAMRAVGQETGRLPRARSDLSDEAYATFMEKWGDVAHYQGRELDVYTAQVREQELPPAMLLAPHVRQYYEGVKASRWRDNFEEAISYMDGAEVPQ